MRHTKPGGQAPASADLTAFKTEAAPQSLVNVTIELQADGEATTRMRVALRGSTVMATIVAPDSDVAQQLSSNMGELRRALADRGFTDSSIAIRVSERAATGSQAAPDSDREGRERQKNDDSSKKDNPGTAHERERRGSRDSRSQGGFQ